jgi:hypothetical protein
VFFSTFKVGENVPARGTLIGYNQRFGRVTLPMNDPHVLAHRHRGTLKVTGITIFITKFAMQSVSLVPGLRNMWFFIGSENKFARHASDPRHVRGEHKKTEQVFVRPLEYLLPYWKQPAMLSLFGLSNSFFKQGDHIFMYKHEPFFIRLGDSSCSRDQPSTDGCPKLFIFRWVRYYVLYPLQSPGS